MGQVSRPVEFYGGFLCFGVSSVELVRWKAGQSLPSPELLTHTHLQQFGNQRLFKGPGLYATCCWMLSSVRWVLWLLRTSGSAPSGQLSVTQLSASLQPTASPWAHPSLHTQHCHAAPPRANSPPPSCQIEPPIAVFFPPSPAHSLWSINESPPTLLRCL